MSNWRAVDRAAWSMEGNVKAGDSGTHGGSTMKPLLSWISGFLFGVVAGILLGRLGQP